MEPHTDPSQLPPVGGPRAPGGTPGLVHPPIPGREELLQDCNFDYDEKEEASEIVALQRRMLEMESNFKTLLRKMEEIELIATAALNLARKQR